jgi:pimeloyl-ACP methyl ester carboxylesterase
MPVSRINGVNINWRVVGDHGPWVVMTTGGRRGHDEFIPLAEKLAQHGFRVMLHDRRNTGASDVLIEGAEGEEVIWTRDLHALMSEHNALPAFFSGSSSGARTSILYCLRYPKAARGLLLLRVTGGAFAAGRLPEQYYGQYMRAAEQGGMGAICAMEQWRERIKANPANGDYLARLPVRQFIDILTRWNEIFVAGGQHPVMGVTPDELRAITALTLVIPGKDKTHARASGLAAHHHIAGSVLHQLPIEDRDEPLIPFPQWSAYEPEIARVFAEFMKRKIAA